jgi:hypothetical protein
LFLPYPVRAGLQITVDINVKDFGPTRKYGEQVNCNIAPSRDRTAHPRTSNCSAWFQCD